MINTASWQIILEADNIRMGCDYILSQTELKSIRKLVTETGEKFNKCYMTLYECKWDYKKAKKILKG